MKRLFSLRVLLALISCCALAAIVRGTSAGAAAEPAAQPATLDLADFGAVGDGVTNDGPAIQRALDALADAGGGTLTVPRGRFAILTPVTKDFRGKATDVTISGVPSSINPNPKGSGAEMTIGLGLVSEFVIKTGPSADGLSIHGLDTLLISDIVFIGTQSASTDARISLGLYVIRDAVVRHCEFYGLRSLSSGGAVLHAQQSGLTLEKSVFLGSSGSSAHRIPVVQNATWKSFVMTETIFADYGQRGGYYGKLDIGPFSWVMLGNPAATDNLSPRREAYMRNNFFDEGAYVGISSFPDYYDPTSRPPDLIQVSDFRMNVSSLNAHGIYIYRGARNTLIERGEFMLSRAATSAVELVNAGDVILDELICGADADTIRADSSTRRLTVINSTYNHLHSQAQSTKVIDSPDPDKDPVQYVRQRFLSTLGREADPAANYFWADLLLQCNDVAACLTARRGELSAYLATSPQPRFSITGRATKDGGSGLSGVTVNLSGSQTVAAATTASGDYTFAGLPTSGDYTLTPARVNYTFSPASQAVSRPAGDRTVNFAGAVKRYRIAGRIAVPAGAPVSGVTVTLSGTETGTATTDANGNYSIGVAAEGSYTVTPARTNYSFSPASRTFSNVVADQTADFTGTPLSYTISGRVTEGASGLAGVALALSGSMAGTTTTDANGNYSFTAVAGGDYTVTPSHANYTFAPASRAFNDLLADQTSDFAATPKTYTVSGRVLSINNTGMSGVTVTLSGSRAGTATTDSSGAYAFAALPFGGNYTVTPTLTHFDMSPSSRTFSNLQSDQTADFVASFTKYKIGGRVTAGGNGLAGVTVTLGGSEGGTTTTDAAGNYTFNATARGVYTVTPSHVHYVFTPASRTFNDLLANQTADFSGALKSYAVGGRVLSINNTGMSGVTVTLSGTSSGTATTDSNGAFSFPGLQFGGTYTVTPTFTHFDMSPSSRTFSNLQSDQSVNFFASLTYYTISGRITEGAGGLSGVTVTMSGSQSGTTTTDANGNYSFSAQARGNYTVTPSRANYTFSPVSQTFNDVLANKTANFAATATVVSHTISGRVTAGAAGLSGVTVTLSGSASGTRTTDANGNYSFSAAAGGNYTVTPARTNYSFTPASTTINNLSANSTANFSATLVSYRIAGRVTSGGAGLGGVALALSGSQAAQATSAPDGSYSFSVPAAGNYTVTPALAHYAFTPPSAAFNNLSADATANFSGALVSYKISGRITSPGGASLSGVSVVLGGSQTGTASTDANGNYSFNVTALGDYTVTPSKPHYSFTPAAASLADIAANATADFTGSPVSYTISGRVTGQDGGALGGTTVTLSGSQSGTTTTDANGNYGFSVVAEGSYTVTPARTNYSFTPASLTFGNVVANQTADFTGTTAGLKITGRVTTAGGAALSGVSVTLSGAASAATTTDSSGNYSFAGLLAGGTYTVTPALAHHGMTPASRTISNLQSDQSADFTAALVSYTIGGRVTVGGSALSGVTVTMSGTQSGTTTTDANGNYSFAAQARGNYTVTPSLTGYTFSPAGQTFNDLVANQTANFAASVVVISHTISGRVTEAGNGLSGVTVTLSGTQAGTAVTDASGNYSFSAAAGGNYTVTPARTNYSFTPASRAFNGLLADQTADFAAAQIRNIGFAAAAFNASEAAGAVTVTVVRTGDVSAAAEVIVSAADGSADQRADLSPVIGAVSFAPGEASKTVVIFITDDAHQEGAEQLTLLLSGAVGGTLAEPSTATLTIADNDSAPSSANPIDAAQFFVRQHYLDFLGREPDAEGLDFWSKQILSCGTDPGCVEEKRINVSAAFFLAIEFQETGYFVHRLYKAAYARAPRHVGEFLLDSRQVGRGLVVNAPGWKELLEDNKSGFARVFVEREDFRDAYPLELTPAEFVGRLDERAGAPLGPAELAAAVAEFGGAPTSADAGARSRALRRVVESDALRLRELNAAFVLMQYFGYLQRNPDDPPNTDLSGYNFWLTKLEEHGGDHRAAQMVRSFLVSGEYRARFGR